MTRDEVVLIGEISKLFDEIERLQKLVPEWHTVDDSPKKVIIYQIITKGNTLALSGLWTGTDWLFENGEPIRNVRLWCPMAQGPEVTTW